MGRDTLLVIAAQEARQQCRNEPDINERIRKAMKACRGHWLVTDTTEQLRAALAAAYLESSIEDQKRIIASIQAANMVFNNILHGELTLKDIEEALAFARDEEAIPIGKLWRESQVA